MKCQHCEHEFSTKYNLTLHQNKAKYCLLIQGKTIETFKCEFCQKKFNRNSVYTTHTQSCKVKKSQLNSNKIQELEIKIQELLNIIIEKDKEIIKLKVLQTGEKEKTDIFKNLNEKASECIQKIAEQPRTQNTINNKLLLVNPLDLSDDRIRKIVQENFTDEHFYEGQRGMARFANSHLLRDEDGNLNYVCTDPARHVFKYKGADGEIERDIRAKKLTNAMNIFVTPKSREIACGKLADNSNADSFLLVMENSQSIKDSSEDNSDFRTELAGLTTV